MCGLIGYSGSFDVALLQKGLSAISHRGPDDVGIFVDDIAGIGLGHVRLSIIDPSPLGHQPMLSADGRVVLAFVGEIYNHRELRCELEKKGFQFKGHSDTEVLLNLYIVEGDGMLSRLNGIFSIAIWDAQKDALFLARDALGVKPLYVATSVGGIIFGSEIKGLLELIPNEREVDSVSVHRYLSFLWCPGNGTPLKNVKKVLPGEAMWFRQGSIERRWFWYHLPIFRASPLTLSINAAIKGTVDHLRQAVYRQMGADVPVGAFLSGGLDSSAIVTFAREVDPNIHCFTMESVGWKEEGMVDDLPYACRVAKHLGLTLEVVRTDSKCVAEDLQDMVIKLDEPLADPAALNSLYICQLARKQGIKVLLSGTGGDDIFTGYRRHLAIQAERYWYWLPDSVRGILQFVTSNMDQRKPLFRRLAKIFGDSGLEGDSRLAKYFFWTQKADLFALYTPALRAELVSVLTEQPMLEFLEPLPKSLSPLERVLALEQRFFLADHNLIYTDKMSMAAGVEVRVPFLDLDLVDFAHRIPIQLKQRGREGKWILKKAMEPYLPNDVIYRSKTGFGVPLRHWLRYELSELMGDLLSLESLKRRALFDPKAVHLLIARNQRGEVDGSYTLFSLLCIEIWCRAYIDVRTTASNSSSDRKITFETDSTEFEDRHNGSC